MQVPDNLIGNMTNVILPTTSADAVKELQYRLDNEYNIYIVAVSVFSHTLGSPIYFTRLSAQVYVEMSDFVRLGELVLMILNENDT
jgi:hypothetical protein